MRRPDDYTIAAIVVVAGLLIDALAVVLIILDYV